MSDRSEKKKSALPEGFKRTLLICTNWRPGADKPSCAGRGGKEIAQALIEGLKNRKIDLPYEEVCCLGQCTDGPALRLTGEAFHLHTTLDDVPRILDELQDRFGVKL